MELANGTNPPAVRALNATEIEQVSGGIIDGCLPDILKKILGPFLPQPPKPPKRPPYIA